MSGFCQRFEDAADVYFVSSSNKASNNIENKRIVSKFLIQARSLCF